ncbi:MAG: topoisomerase DNA-binding C4 zinc finger domain-containing protein [Patescibacteria group bacterium]|nr:MAG: topoisomerase DNA-binding C4 zinc finger domain-containing protein [Patescibacteria group bacterium]
MQESASGTAVQEKVCPKCAGKLVQRKSKFGPFTGCGNYPQCKHIERK